LGQRRPSGFAALFSDYRHFAGDRLWTALALMILGALAEGFGLMMIVPIATIAIHGGTAAVRYAPWTATWTTDERFMAALGLFVGAMAVRSVLLFARDVLLARLQTGYEADLKLRAAATLANRGWPFASGIGQAGMQALLLGDVPRAGQAVAFLQNVAVAATMLFVQLALAFILSPTLTLVAIGFLAVGAGASMRITRRGVASGFAISDAMDDSTTSGFRLHAGLKAALAQGTIAAFLTEYRSGLDRTAQQLTRFTRDYSSSRQLAAFGAALVAAVLLLIGVRLLALPFAILVTSLILFARMSAPAQLLQASALQAAATAPSFAGIEARLGRLDSAPSPSAAPAALEWQTLALRDASYEHAPGLGVRDATLQLDRGDWIGLRGASGAGKTTLLDLVAGLLQPQSGAVSIDDRPVGPDALPAWQAAIAYVGQDGMVFSDTVRGNLLAEGAGAGHVELWRALEIVGLGERVRAFPAGLNEPLGDRGSRLSGGERQRLVFARALLRRPSLLILDEATSALDPAGEAQLIGRLRSLNPRPAALVVAHRESTLSHCDRVLDIQHWQRRATPVRDRNDLTRGSPGPG
jgi:ATP-binding cassette subfamily C protein